MSVIKITVDEQNLHITDSPKIAAQGVNENQVEFAFSEDWDGFGKTAIFYNESDPETVYTSLVDGNGRAVIPHEVTASEGRISLGLSGVKDNIVKTSEILTYKIVKGLYVAESAEPSPGIYEQMLTIVGAIQSDQASFIADIEADQAAFKSEIDTDQTEFKSEIEASIAEIESETSSGIDVIDARVDNLVADTRAAESTTIWSGNMSADGGSYTLSHDVSNFDFLDIFYDNVNTGVTHYLRIPANKAAANIYVPYFETDVTPKPLEVGKVSLSFSGTSVTVSAAKQYFWDGTFTNAPTIFNAQHTFPVRIDGVKTASNANAEVADIRVGADGTTYATAGAAVRGQVNDLRKDLDNLFNDITVSIPGAIDSASNKCKLTLQDYSGKKAFISNKNLFPQFPATTDHGVTCVQNNDGSITLSGTSSAVASFQLSSNVMPAVGKGTYTLSARNPSAIGDNLTYINPSINGSYSGTIACRLNAADAKTTFTLTEGETITAIRIRIAANVTLPDNYTLYPQLEEGEEQTAFVAHDGYIIDLTSGQIETDCFNGYNYICAQVGVTGTVTFKESINEKIKELDDRITILENQPSESKKLSGKTIVCFGDSITGNFPAPTDYPSMIADITGANVYNAGFGGCCMSDNGQTRRLFTMCRLVDSIVAGDFSAQRNSGVSITYGGTSIDYVPERLTMLEGIDWSEVDYITIAYGTNDWNSNYGLDNENDPLDITTYIGAFRYSIEKLLTAYPNIKILPISPLWRWWDTNTGMPSEITADYIDSNDYHKGTGYYLWNYGDALMKASEKYQIPCFDLYHNCMMNKFNRHEYFSTNDGTHPKHEGIKMMAEMISAHLEAAY